MFNESLSAALRVIHPGLWTTIQDLGRTGFRKFGVPVGGAFDRGAHTLANALVGNRPDAATLEMTLFGGTFEILIPIAAALAGAPVEAWVEHIAATRSKLRAPQSFSLEAGDRLVMRGVRHGARTYLAVRGGWHGEVVLGSRSTETPLHAGEVLHAASGHTPVLRPAEAFATEFGVGLFTHETTIPLRVVIGPDASTFDEKRLRGVRFRVSNANDRMGLRLEPPDGRDFYPAEIAAERLSEPLAPGAVQATHGGLIVLGVACGTMGGYPHLAQVVSPDLCRLAQVKAGDTVVFEFVPVERARRLAREQEIRRARAALRLTTRAGSSAG